MIKYINSSSFLFMCIETFMNFKAMRTFHLFLKAEDSYSLYRPTGCLVALNLH